LRRHNPTARGYTGHEHIDLFELVNMDGRVYDPRLGRFLSPDPYVQDPTYSQSLNRYSYCVNNPLVFYDPSGYTWLSRAWKWAKNNVGTIITVTYLAAAVVCAILVPPLGFAMLGAYIGGAMTNNWELNAEKWNWSSPATYGGIIIGAIAGYLVGYGLVHPGTVKLSLKFGFADLACVGVDIYKNDFRFTWTTNAGGRGDIPLSGKNRTPEELTNKGINEAREMAHYYESDNWESYYKNQYGDPSVSLEEFATYYKGKTENQIIYGQSSFLGYKFPNNMDYRYVRIGNGREVDMIHFMVVGRRGHLLGIANEVKQAFSLSKSAFYPRMYIQMH